MPKRLGCTPLGMSNIISDIVPPGVQPLLKRMGRVGWSKPRPVGDQDRCQWEYDIERLRKELSPTDFGAAVIALAAGEASGGSAIILMSKLMASGPKLFRPTVEMCESLMHVDPKVTFEQFQQPFPVMIYELPPQFIARRALPKLIVAVHEPGGSGHHGYLLFRFQSGGLSEPGVNYQVINRPQYSGKGLDELLQRLTPTKPLERGPENYELTDIASRLAINLALSLTCYGTRVQWLDKKGHHRHLDMARSKDRHRREKGNRLLGTDIKLVEFHQDIIFREFEEPSDQQRNREHGGGTVRPHFRRGHFRRQRFGPLRLQTKIVFIKPVLVRAVNFVGDVADTTVTYRGASASSQWSSP